MKNKLTKTLLLKGSLLVAAMALTSCGTSHDESVSKDAIDRQIAYELGDDLSEADRREIEMLARAGDPELKRDRSYCHDLFLGLGKHDRPICLKAHRLPSEVFSEIQRANHERFLNYSDYDIRVTKLYVFDHGGRLDRNLASADLDALVKAFGIPDSVLAEIREPYRERSTVRERSYLNALSTHFVGSEPTSHPKSLEFAKDILDGAPITTYSWGTEVSLYPGGGFVTGFNFLVSDQKLLFIKLEGWNS